MRPYPHARSESVQDAVGIAAIGDGYLLRDDGVAVGLAELTPPDLHMHDDTSLQIFLNDYTTLLRSSGDRMLLYTYAVAPDLRPILKTLAEGISRAPDELSFAVLRALSDFLEGAQRATSATPTVRWILAIPTVVPETPPRGTWGELQPASLVGQMVPLSGDPVEEALVRIRRAVGQFAELGMEPRPHLLSASEIRVLMALALDPVRLRMHPLSGAHAPCPLQLTDPFRSQHVSPGSGALHRHKE